ncbi:MAG: CHASE2 domain-containing protein, partial [Gammaproteobacteria bacterium]|nr:CHASE2 domain-containing protein [Gammaproteobacteria bacterium]
MKNGVFKSDWFTGLVITFIFLIFAGSDFIASIERSAYDFGVRSSSRIASDKIAIIAIDDQSIDNIGRWPWSRDVHAQMHDILSQGGAKAVGQTVFFSEPQLDPGLQFIRELRQAFEESSISAVPMFVEELALSIEESSKLVTNKRDVKGKTAVKKIAEALEESPLRHQVAEELDAYLEYINSAEVILDTDKTLATSMQNAGN